MKKSLEQEIEEFRQNVVTSGPNCVIELAGITKPDIYLRKGKLLFHKMYYFKSPDLMKIFTQDVLKIFTEDPANVDKHAYVGIDTVDIQKLGVRAHAISIILFDSIEEVNEHIKNRGK